MKHRTYLILAVVWTAAACGSTFTTAGIPASTAWNHIRETSCNRKVSCEQMQDALTTCNAQPPAAVFAQPDCASDELSACIDAIANASCPLTQEPEACHRLSCLHPSTQE